MRREEERHEDEEETHERTDDRADRRTRFRLPMTQRQKRAEAWAEEKLGRSVRGGDVLGGGHV